jgi:hypothetical protein
MVAKVTSNAANRDLVALVMDIDGESGLHAAVNDHLLANAGLQRMWQQRLEFMWHDAFIAAVLVHPAHTKAALAMPAGKQVYGSCYSL